LLLSPQAAIEGAEDTIINLDEFTQDALARAEPGAYNVRWECDKYIIRTKPIYFINGKVIFNKMEYPATKGLLQLLMRKNSIDYDEDDLEDYGNILDETGAIYQSRNMPIDRNSAKWKNIVRPIWGELHPKTVRFTDYKQAQRQSGNSVIFLSSNPML